MESSKPPEADSAARSQDSGVLGSLLTGGDVKNPSTPLSGPSPTCTASSKTPVTPVVITANTLLGQLQPGSAVKPTSPDPLLSPTSTPLIIGLISSGPDTKATLTVPTIKSPKLSKAIDSLAPISGGSETNLVSVPQESGGHGSGKPKAFLSMLGEKARTPPSAGTTKKQSSSTKKGPGGIQSSKSASSLRDSGPRSSQRAIKRPRYFDDDEAVDLEAPKHSSKKTRGTPKGTAKASTRKPSQPMKSLGATKDLGRWRPTDDLMLISAVQQTNDLAAVYLGIKFSCRFTLREIEERWYALLYNPQISHIAVEAMRGLHPGVVTMALNNALWSQEEEAVLAKIPSSDAGHLETFQAILKDNPTVFHACRTATSLHHHWVLMGHYNLLNDQKVQLIPPGDNVTDFTDAEDQKSDAELVKPRDVREEALEQELIANDRLSKREIMRLEEDLPLWRTVLDTGAMPDFQADELAVFRGKVVEFRMKKKSVTFGRATPTNKVDFDLSLEGPAYKISRRQASIHCSEEGEILLHNEGRRVVFVDGRAVFSGRSARLESNQTIEVGSMSFLVLLNNTSVTGTDS